VAYQTAYLKAHYPSEYMAAVMSNNQGNLEKITFFMEESRKMGIPVLGTGCKRKQHSFCSQ
jgi:DNA polymerase-3 subunit alpha